jgi:hypothetical protein
MIKELVYDRSDAHFSREFTFQYDVEASVLHLCRFRTGEHMASSSDCIAMHTSVPWRLYSIDAG